MSERCRQAFHCALAVLVSALLLALGWWACLQMAPQSVQVAGGPPAGEQAVTMRGSLYTLLAQRQITESGTISSTALTGLDRYSRGSFLLTVADGDLSGGGTVNVYVQRSVDEGTSWDDLVSYTQIISGTMTGATYRYVADVNADSGASVADRAQTDGSLAAHSVRSVTLGDRLRVKVVSASFAGSDAVTVTLQGYLNR